VTLSTPTFSLFPVICFSESLRRISLKPAAFMRNYLQRGRRSDGYYLCMRWCFAVTPIFVYYRPQPTQADYWKLVGNPGHELVTN